MRPTCRDNFLILFLVLVTAHAFGQYSTENGKVIFRSPEYGTVELAQADLASFTPVKIGTQQTNFAKDINHAYFYGTQIPGAIGSSFRLLNREYATDGKHVFFTVWTLKDADPITFTALSDYYAKDDKTVFYEWRPFDVKDVGTFDRDLEIYSENPDAFYSRNELFSRDQYSYYFNDGGMAIEMAVAHRENFQVLPYDKSGFNFGLWTTDGESFYCRGLKVPLKDRNTFKILNSFYSKDATAVYFVGAPVADADPESFEINSDGDQSAGYDKNHRFRGGKIKN